MPEGAKVVAVDTRGFLFLRQRRVGGRCSVAWLYLFLARVQDL